MGMATIGAPALKMKKTAAMCCICMVVVLLAGQQVMATPEEEAGPTGRRLLQLLPRVTLDVSLSFGGSGSPIVVSPCPFEPKCQACVSGCAANNTDGIPFSKCASGCPKAKGGGFGNPWCPADPECEGCQSRCQKKLWGLDLEKCFSECARGRESFHGCPSDAKCEACRSPCDRAWSTSRDDSAYKACARKCGMKEDAHGFMRCPTDRKCEGCAADCPACNTSPGCRNECKNKCAGL